jgi:methylglutaconyl-CoA hydratase
VKTDYQYIEVELEAHLVRITLNRPERHNTIVPGLLHELHSVLDEVALMDELLFVVLSGNGKSFCAGADLHWFSGAEERSLKQNADQYKQLADVLLQWFRLPQITIAAMRGNVFGGGLGLMSVCDFVLAENNARFMFSEVKLGLLPATILPFVSKRLSLQYLRKWILTGNLFTAPEAAQAGLVDVICEYGELDLALKNFLANFNSASPTAVKKAKQLINQVVAGDIDVEDTTYTSTVLAKALLSPDGQEGIHAFLEKRNPKWK